MAINRAPFNALVDDDGSNTVGTPWNKQAIKDVVLDPVDAALAVGQLAGAAAGISTSTAAAYVNQIAIPGGVPLGHCVMIRLALNHVTGPRPTLVRIDLAGVIQIVDITASLPAWTSGPLIATVLLMTADTVEFPALLLVSAAPGSPVQGTAQIAANLTAAFTLGLLVQQSGAGSTNWAWQAEVI